MILVDCRGLTCPQPVIRCRDSLAEGATALEILVDNDAARENVARFLRGRGFEVAWAAEDGGLWRLTAHADKPGVAEDEKTAAPEAASATRRETRTLVLVTTETLGRGDEELGGKLMANFLTTLPELGARLWRLVLLNGGVKLAVPGSDSLQDLQELERQGVEILACGTCLNYYGLTEQLAVGSVTNMYQIVEKMNGAGKIIRP